MNVGNVKNFQPNMENFINVRCVKENLKEII